MYENRVSYRLRKGVNQIIAEGTTVAHAPDVGQFGPFQTTVSWQDDTPGKTAELEVFSVRPKDGAPDHVVSFPVLLD